MKKVISIDIGGTFIKYGLVNEAGTVLCKDKRATVKSGA